MILVGSRSPTFDCTAIVNCEVQELAWNQLCENKVLVLLFTSFQFDSAQLGYLFHLNNKRNQIEQLRTKIAIVCRDDLYDIRVWLDNILDEEGLDSFSLPIIVDSDNRIASLYDLLFPDGRATWGHLIIDADGIVQQASACSVPLETDVNELIRCIEGVRAIPSM